LDIKQQDNAESVLAWKISNKGQGLRALTEKLMV
jgi:hypothetical protein